MMSLNPYPAGTFSGSYEISDPYLLECAPIVIGHEFGEPGGVDSCGMVNRALAAYIAEYFPDKIIYATATIAAAFEEDYPHIKPAGVVHDISANATASEGGTALELARALEMAKAQGNWTEGTLTIHVGQAHHIGRIAVQAKKQGMNPLLPPDLPNLFDPESSQLWCHNQWAWGMRELVGIPVLRLRDQM